MYYFIVNLHGKSGYALNQWRKIHTELKRRQLDFKAFSTKSIGEAKDLAKRISDLNDDDIRIVVAGGDGTFNEVINGIADFSKVKVGLVPLGSANDLANGMGLLKEPIVSVNQILNSKGDKKIDLGRVTFSGGESRFFAISAGVGLDAEICKKANESRLKSTLNKLGCGSKSYVVLAAQSLVELEYVKVVVEADGEAPVFFDKMIFMGFMNMSVEGGGVPMSPDAKYDDGYIDMCCGHGCEKIEAPFLLMKLIMGKHVGDSHFDFKRFKNISVHAEKPVCLHTDGEYCGNVTDISIECLESKLCFLV